MRPTRWVTVVLATATAAAVLGSGGAALAAPPGRDDVQRRQGEVQGELQQSQDALNGISSQLTDAVAALDTLQAELSQARGALDQARSAADAAQAHDADVAAQVDVATAAVQATQAELAARRADMEQTRADMGGVVRATYRGSDLNSLAIIVEAQDPQEYADMLSLARAAKRSQDRTLDRLQEQQAQLTTAEDRQRTQLDRLVELKGQSEAAVRQSRDAAAAASEAAARTDDLVARQQQTVADVSAAKAAEEQRLSDLQDESASLQARLAEIAAQEQAAAAAAAAAASRPAPAGGAPVTTTGGGYLSAPVSARVNSGFGYRIHPILGYERLHTGLDFAAGCGTPVRAAADGTVTSAGAAGGYGNQLVVSHGLVDGVSLATTYNHLTSFAVTSGAVSRGQVIAYVGTTGLSTGCHLHFEARESGAPVDPRKWM